MIEKRKLTAIHEKQISAGVHRGRINQMTGLTEPYYVLDLPSSEELHEENVIDLPPRDAKALQQAYEYIRRKSNVKEKQKINLYLDRFLKVTSSLTPSACQRDLSETNFHVFTYDINV